MGEHKVIPRPFTVTGIEVPVHKGFLYNQATKIFQDMNTAVATLETDLTASLIAYLKAQGIDTVKQITLLRNALSLPINRPGNPFTEKDKDMVRGLTDVIGIMNMPQPLPPEDLGPRETARDIGHGRDRSPKKK